MKLFLACGSGESDWEDTFDFDVENSSNAHSSGLVIIADSLETAKGLIPKEVTCTLTEIPMDKAGIVLYADGDC